jgi:hypothetical protein
MALSYGIALQNGPTFWPVKQCDETLSYAWDKGAWLLANGSDSIASVTATIPWTISGDAQVVALNVVGSVITVRITGGLPGETYACSISGTTTLGNAFADTLFLPINAPFTEAGEPAPTPLETVAATLTWPSGDPSPPTGPFLPIDGSVPMTGPLNAPQVIVPPGWASGFGINAYSSDDDGDLNYLQDGFGAWLQQDPDAGTVSLLLFASGLADAPVSYLCNFNFGTDGSFSAPNGIYANTDQSLGMYDAGNNNRYLQLYPGFGWHYAFQAGGPLEWLAQGSPVFSIDDEGNVVAAGSINATGPLTVTRSSGGGANLIADASGGSGNWANLQLKANAAGAAAIQSFKFGLGRWTVELGGTGAETGGNAGSDFALTSFNDDGTFLGYPITVERATGNVAITMGALSLPNGSSLAPALQIGAADGTGFWRAPGNVVGLAVAGSFVAAFASALAQFYQPLNMLTNKIQQLGDATTATDALNLRTADARYAPITLADEVAALRAELLTLRSTRPL